MSEAVNRLLLDVTKLISMARFQKEFPQTRAVLSKRLIAVESELNKPPAEQHQERLEEVLEWNR